MTETKKQLLERLEKLEHQAETYAAALTIILESGQLRQEMEHVAMVGLGYLTEQTWYDVEEMIRNKLENR